MALSEAGPWFAQADPRFADNIAAYYEKVREEDLLTTHTLIPPQANRAAGPGQQVDGRALGAHVVREDDNGIVVRGARMLATIGPIADELLVFPSTVLKGTPEDAPYSFAFAINCDAPGLRFICRENLDYGRNHPLGGRFDEIDAVVIFDDVHVPWERVFMLGLPELCNSFYTDTSAVVHMTHQVTARTTAKAEAFLGLMSLMTEAIGIEQFSHIQEDLAQVITIVGTLHGLGARRRGRRGAQRVRRLHAGLGAAQHGAQLVPEGLAAAAGDRPQVRRERPHGDSDRGRHRRHGQGGRRALPAVGRALGARARAIVPPRVGPVRLVRLPAARTCTSTTSSVTRCVWRARC